MYRWPLFVSVLTLCGIPLSAADWKAIDPGELAEKSSKVEKDADAEAIFWDIRITNEFISGYPHTVWLNYIRIKIYNDHGRDRLSTIDIPVYPKTFVSDIAGRTIHPDGSITELKKDAIYERTSKVGNTTLRNTSFPMPAVEPGSIIEYRWKLSRDATYSYLRLDFQREIPVRVVRYALKPYRNTTWHMHVQDFHCQHAPFAAQPDGFYVTTIESVPAFKEEPQMPPANAVRAWSLVYYSPDERKDPEKFWIEHGKAMYKAYKLRMKVGKEITQKAAEITAEAHNPEEKLALLSDFCRRNIKNVQRDTVTAEEREEADKNKTPEDTLDQGLGTPEDIRLLFAALATAQGFDVRIALLPNRGNIFFDRNVADSYFLTGRAVAVKVNDNWRFYNPAGTYIPLGMLAWHEEGVPALVTDSKEPFFLQTPLSTPEQSVARSIGSFKLTEDGSLEGDITITYTGHTGAIRKEVAERQSEAQREETFKKTITNRITTAEISKIVIENVMDLEKPITYMCHIRAPGYAQRTGKRLFLAPAFFRQGATALFSVKERKYPIYFHYPFTDVDLVTIEMPVGFELESPTIPAPILFGAAGKYDVHASVVDKRRLVYVRKFVFGENGQLLIKESSYSALKDRFDALVTSDAQTISLKQADAKAATGGQ